MLIMLHLICATVFLSLGVESWMPTIHSRGTGTRSRSIHNGSHLKSFERFKICSLFSSNEGDIAAEEPEDNKVKFERPKIPLEPKSTPAENKSKSQSLPKDDSKTTKVETKIEKPKDSENANQSAETPSEVEKSDGESKTSNVKDLIKQFSKGEIDKESFENGIKAKELESIRTKELEFKAKLKLNANEAVWASVNTCILGLVAGGLADGYLFDGGFPLCSPLVATVLTGPTYYFGKQNNAGGEVIRKIFGRPLKNVSDSITQPIIRTAQQTQKNVVGFPSYLKEGIEQKVKGTIDGIKAVPANTSKAIGNTVDGVKASITNATEGIKQEVSKKNEETKLAIANKVTEVKNEIVAIPKKVVEEVKRVPSKTASAASDSVDWTKRSVTNKIGEAKKSVVSQIDQTKKGITDKIDETKKGVTDKIDETKKNVVDTVNNVVAFPGKVVDDASKMVSSILPKSSPKLIPKEEIKMSVEKEKSEEISEVSEKEVEAEVKQAKAAAAKKNMFLAFQAKKALEGEVKKEAVRKVKKEVERLEKKADEAPKVEAKEALKAEAKEAPKAEVKEAPKVEAKEAPKAEAKEALKVPPIGKILSSPFQTTKNAKNDEPKKATESKVEKVAEVASEKPKVEANAEAKLPAIGKKFFSPFQDKPKEEKIQSKAKTEEKDVPKMEMPQESKSLFGLTDLFGSKAAPQSSLLEEKLDAKIAPPASKIAASLFQSPKAGKKVPKESKVDVEPTLKSRPSNPFDFFRAGTKAEKVTNASSATDKKPPAQKSNSKRFTVQPREKPTPPPRAAPAPKKVNRNFSAPPKMPTKTGPISVTLKGKKESEFPAVKEDVEVISEAKNGSEEEMESVITSSAPKQLFSMFNKKSSAATNDSPELPAKAEPSTEEVSSSRTSFGPFGVIKSAAKSNDDAAKESALKVEVSEMKEEIPSAVSNPFNFLKFPAKKSPAKEIPPPSSTTASTMGLFKPALVNSLKERISESQISSLENLAAQYATGKVSSPRTFVEGAIALAGSQVIMDTLPDIIGSLPAGDKKRDLNQYYLTSI